MDKIDSEGDKHKGNVLVLSHVGPFTSNTDNDYEVGLVYSDSQSFNDFLLKYENKIIEYVLDTTILGQEWDKCIKSKFAILILYFSKVLELYIWWKILKAIKIGKLINMSKLICLK